MCAAYKCGVSIVRVPVVGGLCSSMYVVYEVSRLDGERDHDQDEPSECRRRVLRLEERERIPRQITWHPRCGFHAGHWLNLTLNSYPPECMSMAPLLSVHFPLCVRLTHVFSFPLPRATTPSWHEGAWSPIPRRTWSSSSKESRLAFRRASPRRCLCTRVRGSATRNTW